MRPAYLLGLGLLLLACQRPDLHRLDEVLYVRHAGADMPAYVHGNGAEKVFLIVLHGAGSFGLAFRDGAFTQELETRYAVVYWDQRGQSMAQGHYDRPEDIVSLMASDVEALVAVLQHHYGDDIRLFLLGHSWGGALGTTVLLRPGQQERFRGWIAVDAAHDFPFAGTARRRLLLDICAERLAAGAEPEAWEALQTQVAALDSVAEADYQPMLDLGLAVSRRLVTEEVVPTGRSGTILRRAVFDNNPLTWQVSAALNQPFAVARDQGYSLTDQLGDIHLPSLLLWGKYDISVPPTLGADALRRLGSSDKTLVLFDRSIHHPHDTEPEAFARAVVAFIERLK